VTQTPSFFPFPPFPLCFTRLTGGRTVSRIVSLDPPLLFFKQIREREARIRRSQTVDPLFFLEPPGPRKRRRVMPCGTHDSAWLAAYFLFFLLALPLPLPSPQCNRVAIQTSIRIAPKSASFCSFFSFFFPSGNTKKSQLRVRAGLSSRSFYSIPPFSLYFSFPPLPSLYTETGDSSPALFSPLTG